MTKKAEVNAPWINPAKAPVVTATEENNTLAPTICKGPNCTARNDDPSIEHSDECLAEYGQIMNQTINVATDNPFAPKAPVPIPVHVPTVRPDGTPMWGDLVKFVQKHAALITQVRYPEPMGECIDTIRKGIRVYDHEEAMIRHIEGQWVTWADAQAINQA